MREEGKSMREERKAVWRCRCIHMLIFGIMHM